MWGKKFTDSIYQRWELTTNSTCSRKEGKKIISTCCGSQEYKSRIINRKAFLLIYKYRTGEVCFLRSVGIRDLEQQQQWQQTTQARLGCVLQSRTWVIEAHLSCPWLVSYEQWTKRITVVTSKYLQMLYFVCLSVAHSEFHGQVPSCSECGRVFYA